MEWTLTDEHLILLSGATGYIGGRLLNALDTRGHRLRSLGEGGRKQLKGIDRQRLYEVVW